MPAGTELIAIQVVLVGGGQFGVVAVAVATFSYIQLTVNKYRGIREGKTHSIES